MCTTDAPVVGVLAVSRERLSVETAGDEWGRKQRPQQRVRELVGINPRATRIRRLLYVANVQTEIERIEPQEAVARPVRCCGRECRRRSHTPSPGPLDHAGSPCSLEVPDALERRCRRVLEEDELLFVAGDALLATPCRVQELLLFARERQQLRVRLAREPPPLSRLELRDASDNAPLLGACLTASDVRLEARHSDTRDSVAHDG